MVMQYHKTVIFPRHSMADRLKVKMEENQQMSSTVKMDLSENIIFLCFILRPAWIALKK